MFRLPAPVPGKQIPKIAVFMNKTKPYAGGMTKESQFYWGEVKRVCRQASKSAGLNVKCLEAPIYDRAAIKRAVVTGGVPSAFVPDFKILWNEITSFFMPSDFTGPSEELLRLGKKSASFGETFRRVWPHWVESKNG